MPDDTYAEFQRVMLDAHDAAVTVLMRSFAMQRAFLTGDWTGGVEAQRMVFEKVAAAQQGLGAAAVVAAKTAMNAPTTPKATARAGARIVKAAAKPARKKLRANARRLTKAKKKKR